MAKRSRKTRTARRTQPAPVPQVTPEKEVVVNNAPTRKKVDFTTDYFYVYKEMRTMLVITVIMIGVMVGLSYIV